MLENSSPLFRQVYGKIREKVDRFWPMKADNMCKLISLHSKYT